MTIADAETLRKKEESRKRYLACYRGFLGDLRKRGETFEAWSSEIGSHEDSIRKALYLSAYWAYTVGYVKTAKRNDQLLRFAENLLYQDKAAFKEMMHRIDIYFFQALSNGVVSHEVAAFAFDLLHSNVNGSIMKEVYSIFYNARPPHFD